MQHALNIRSLDMIVYCVQFSREDSHSAELERRKALEKKVFQILSKIRICVTICFMSSIQTSGSSTDSVDSLYKSFRQFSRLSSTTSTQSIDEDTGHKISKSN